MICTKFVGKDTRQNDIDNYNQVTMQHYYNSNKSYFQPKPLK